MAPVADRTRFRLKFTKKYAPLEHFGSGLVYHADMSDAKNSEGGGDDLDFAMEAGMLGGCDAYNEAMAWD